MASDGLGALRTLIQEMRASRSSGSTMAQSNASPISVANQTTLGGGEVPEMILDDPDWGMYWPADPNDDWVHI